jgi:hypothetical protein
MTRRLLAVVVLVTATLGGCSMVESNPDCRLNERCEAVLAAARTVVSFNDARVVVIPGRGPTFHAEVHVCYSDGTSALVDVMGEDLAAALRDATWERPPCR